MGLLQLRFDFDSASIRLRRSDQNCDSTAIRLRRKMNMFIFCGVERRRSQSDGRGGQFIRTQKKRNEWFFHGTVVYLFYCTGSFACWQV